MVETDIEKYKLNYNNRNQSLKISIIDNQQILLELTYKDTLERYSNFLTISQLKALSKAFDSSKTIKDSFLLIKNTIESGNIVVVEDDNKKTSIEIQFNISLASIDYPSFEIMLRLEDNSSQEKENDQGIQNLPINYNLQNNVVDVKSIIKSDIKPPILELEYIEPIIQTHYPDGTTKNIPLPPRIQGVNGETPNITQEQFQSIQKLIENSTIRDFSPIRERNTFYRSNSLSEMGYLNQIVLNNNILKTNNLNKADISSKQNNQQNSQINNSKTTFNLNNKENQPSNQILQTIYSNRTNFIPKPKTKIIANKKVDFNNYIERRSRISNKNRYERDINRCPSTPSYKNFQKFNQKKVQNIQNVYQINPQKNPFSIATIPQNHNKNPNYQNDNCNAPKNNKRRSPQDKISLQRQNENSRNNKISIREKQTLIQNNLNIIQKQNQKVNEIQQKLAQIRNQQQKYQLNQKKLNINQKQTQNNNLNKTQNILNNKNSNYFARVRLIHDKQMNSTENQQQLRQIPLFNNQNKSPRSNYQQYKTQLSNENKPSKKEMLSDYESEFKTQISSPISSKAPTLNSSEQDQQEQVNQENEQIQEQKPSNIEDLFMTEEGKIIFRNGLLRGIIHKYSEIDDVVTKIQNLLLKGVKFNLVYKAFDLDDKASTFHRKCDDLNKSLVLIETHKDIRFGGFNTKSWKGNCVKKYDKNSFVFSLDNNKIFEIIEGSPAIGCYPNCGPVFFGCQIRIYDEFFTKGGTTCHKGQNYKTQIDYELNNGEKAFLIKDIEVYSLETLDID